MLLQMAKFHSFLWLNSIPLCVYVCVCVYLLNIHIHAYIYVCIYIGASLVAQTVKNLPAVWETRVWSMNLEDPLEKGSSEVATHSSICAWRIPRTEKPGRLQSMGPQRDTPHIFITRSSVDGHAVCFHTLAIVNNTVMNIVVHASCWISAFIFFGCIPRSGITGSYDSSIFSFFWGTSILFSIAAAPTYIPTIRAQGSLFPTSSPTFVCSLLDDSHSDRCEVTSLSGFHLPFSDDPWYWASFHVPFGHLHVFFGKISIQIFCSSFNQVIFWSSVLWAVCILTPYWSLSYTNIFSGNSFLEHFHNPINSQSSICSHFLLQNSSPQKIYYFSVSR